jgi:antitoxin component of RelBE/YafQ-DinJ toxin-antitoxin module
MKKNVGRPPAQPKGQYSTITLRLDAKVKSKLIADSEAVGMTLTEYLSTLIERN